MCHTTLLYVCIIKKRKSSLLVLLTQNKSFFLWGKERHPPLTRRFVFSGHFFLFFPFNFASFFPPCLFVIRLAIGVTTKKRKLVVARKIIRAHVDCKPPLRISIRPRLRTSSTRDYFFLRRERRHSSLRV